MYSFCLIVHQLSPSLTWLSISGLRLQTYKEISTLSNIVLDRTIPMIIVKDFSFKRKVFRCALKRVSLLLLLIGGSHRKESFGSTDQIDFMMLMSHHHVKPEHLNSSCLRLWQCYVDFFAITRRLSWTLVQNTSTSIQSHLTKAVMIRYLCYLAYWVWGTSEQGNGYFEVVSSELKKYLISLILYL